MASWLKSSWAQLAAVLAVAYAACFLLYLYAYTFEHLRGDFFLVVSVSIAVIPLLLAWRLLVSLRHKRWSAWEPLLLTLLWLIFLPGSFYAMSDFIYLQTEPSTNILFISFLYCAFIFLGSLIGLASLYLIQSELKKRLKPVTTSIVMFLVLLVVCFAVYVGRDLNWNSWDIMINPGGFVFDISNLLSKAHNYPNMLRTVSGLLVLLGSVYLVVWRSGRLIWHRGVNDLAAHIKRTRHS